MIFSTYYLTLFGFLVVFGHANASLQSPCPDIFRIILGDDDKPSAIIALPVAKPLIYEFNVTAYFIPGPNVSSPI